MLLLFTTEEYTDIVFILGVCDEIATAAAAAEYWKHFVTVESQILKKLVEHSICYEKWVLLINTQRDCSAHHDANLMKPLSKLLNAISRC